MQRYFIELAYKGTRFHGWQIQPNANSVQESLEKALSVLLRQAVAVTGAGRTDTGVHASYFTAHFDVSDLMFNPVDLVYKLNSFLNDDITIFSIIQVEDQAHARFDAVLRTYQYHINLFKDSFNADTSWYYFRNPDLVKMNEACKILFEYIDFTSFSKLHTDVKTNNCQIFRADWEQKGSQLIFSVSADRFLRNMVRSLVGTLLDVGNSKIDLDGFRAIIESKNRNKAGLSVPAHGLILTDIRYPPKLFQRTVPLT